MLDYFKEKRNGNMLFMTLLRNKDMIGSIIFNI